MGIDEILMAALLPVGTFLLNIWRKYLATSGRAYHLAYIFTSVVIAMTPLIYIMRIEPNQTALGVILAGMALFWFSIVGARRIGT